LRAIMLARNRPAAPAVTAAAWNAFFADLVARGLTSGPDGVLLVTSDAHAGLVEAIAANPRHRCRTHYAANLARSCLVPRRRALINGFRTVLMWAKWSSSFTQAPAP
jgi:transposase-like protein